MNINFARYRKFFVVFTLISAIILALFYNALVPVKTLPIYQPAEVSFELVDSSLHISISLISFLPPVPRFVLL